MQFSRHDSAAYLAAQLSKALSRAVQARGLPLGFSRGQFPILLVLWQEDGLTQRQLLDRLDIEQATLANTLMRMERDGLIERKPHQTDRRARIITLTPKARSIEEEAVAASMEAEDEVLNGLLRFERALLLEYMRGAVAAAKSAS